MMDFLNDCFALFYVHECLPTHMYVHHTHTWCPWRPEEEVKPPEIGVTDGCEPHGCWE